VCPFANRWQRSLAHWPGFSQADDSLWIPTSCRSEPCAVRSAGAEASLHRENELLPQQQDASDRSMAQAIEANCSWPIGCHRSPLEPVSDQRLLSPERVLSGLQHLEQSRRSGAGTLKLNN
jgi:hypothetical protein